MACQRKLRILVVFLFIFASLEEYSVYGKQKVPCYFIFGDSLVDSGNNNNLNPAAKADFPPYGIDFPYGPTGRFTNGQTTADLFGKLMGFKNFIPSFPSANDLDILRGINYGSGSAGIRNETGKQLGAKNIDLSTQLQNHQITISKIVERLGSKESAIKLLNKCLYSFVIGSNDYLNNYFLPQYFNTSKQYSTAQYAQVLVQEYSQHIMNMYNSGARKFALTGIGRLGCIPRVRASQGTNGSLCVDSINQVVNLFNYKLQLLVKQLNNDLNDAKFIYLKTYVIMSNDSPSVNKLNTSECCEVNGRGGCIPNSVPCKDRNGHVFYDAFHPTEIANKIGVRMSYPALKKIL